MNSELFYEMLDCVQKPARYLGNEWNVVKKDHAGRIRVALCFPDTYEIGMSSLGFRILYSILNERDDVVCERAFAPWIDMEAQLKDKGLPLFSLETRTPLSEFDIVAFSIGYELCYTNVLNMLKVSGIPLRGKERTDTHPIVIAGGCAVYNPEPLADFIDCFIIGEGEEAILEVVDAVKRCTQRAVHTAHSMILEEFSRIPGAYVPSVHIGKQSISKRIVHDLESCPFPTNQIVPFIETVHDRISVEIMRGCPFRCKFCQATGFYSPRRERSADTVMRLLKECHKNTGYSEASLLSLSSGSHTQMERILEMVAESFSNNGLSVSLPSLRVEKLLAKFPKFLSLVRRTGLTLAPEAGTERLRQAIGKNISMEHLFELADEAYKNNWQHLKLYFMIGLPTETDEDLDGIIELALKICELRKKSCGRKGNVTVAVSTFIPKPHTQFEREAFAGIDEIIRKKRYLMDKARNILASAAVKLDFRNEQVSMLEAILARGDRELGNAIARASDSGCRFDSWRECFDFGKWAEAFTESAVDPAFYLRKIDPSEELPWGFIRG